MHFGSGVEVTVKTLRVTIRYMKIEEHCFSFKRF
jgi:hypothetical protein